MPDEFVGEGVELDLLGDPIRPIKDPRGRPAFAKTQENQLLVLSLRGAGWSQADIATYLRCSEKTLRKHFSRELDHGAVLLDGMAVQVLVKKMLQGHVGAAKQVREFTQARAPRDDKGSPAKAPALGKKAQADRDATRPTDDWSELLGEGRLN